MDSAHLRHEVRTPLNHIIGYTEMLLEELGDEGAVDLVCIEIDVARGHARDRWKTRDQRGWNPWDGCGLGRFTDHRMGGELRVER